MANLKILTGKNRLQSILPSFLWEMGLCMTHGDTVYAPDNWKDPETSQQADYVGAMLRHIMLYASGETYDRQTGLHHLAHAAASCQIAFYHDCGEMIVSTHRCRCEKCNA